MHFARQGPSVVGRRVANKDSLGLFTVCTKKIANVAVVDPLTTCIESTRAQAAAAMPNSRLSSPCNCLGMATTGD